MYVGFHFSSRSKDIEIRTKTSGKCKIPQYDVFSNFICKNLKNGEKFVYVGPHFSSRRSKAIEIRTKTSGKSEINYNDDIFSNFILKTPVFHFTGIRSKATGIRTKIT